MIVRHVYSEGEKTKENQRNLSKERKSNYTPSLHERLNALIMPPNASKKPDQLLNCSLSGLNDAGKQFFLHLFAEDPNSPVQGQSDHKDVNIFPDG